ncbi:peptidylprolyl isomerase [Herbivorax sp. ANBcel31]|uniref:peptidylprolyl isomerase n=1 Tax=Herbivorax sp. ANBcel31 TaxID=3069754 RepID=UPI0027B45D0D|nr:peptidylprolyl isomerase [Herbivorax sp. ANBcel31]MDQ2084852.1 peptidylprolyl isomerase [Herbivorax sp. ANBcel31]
MKCRKFISFILLSFIIFSLSSCFVSDGNEVNDENGHAVEDYDSFVAEVEGEKITESELRFILGHMKDISEESSNLSGADDEQIKMFWEEEIDGEKRKDIVKRASLDDLIEVKLLVSRAKEENVQLDELDNIEIDELMWQYIQTNGGEELAEIKLQKDFGMNLDEYEKINEELILSAKYKDEAAKNIEIDEEDIRKYYDDNIDRVEMVSIKYILFLTETHEYDDPMTEEEIEEKKELAKEVLSMAEAGEDFDSLTEEYTEDPEYQLYGNEYTFSRNSASEDLKEWSFSSDEGELTMLEVPAGFMVLKLNERHGFEYVKEGIKQTLQKQEFENNLKQWKKQDFAINQEVLDSISILD